MTKKIDSSRVNSYPSTKRASVNKLLTENSITRIINRLIDNDSYVIINGLSGVDYSTDIDIGQWANVGADFEFVIHGYYFSISKGSSVSGLKYLIDSVGFSFSDQVEHTLYARIFIDKVDKDYPELYGQTDSPQGEYEGIQFFIDNEEIIYPDGGTKEEYDVFDAPLVKYMSNDAGTVFGYYVPITSLFKFGSQSIKNIDGGEVIL